MRCRKPTRFQFHEGPIKTAYGSADASHAAAFQFHEGPIKTHRTDEF